MQSTATNVAEYLKEVPEERVAVLTKLRELCLRTLEGYEEGMAYGMPVYSLNGSEGGVAFASQKNYISLYILKTDVMQKYKDQLVGRGVSLGKGCIRYSSPERIDFALVEEMLKASRDSDGEIC